MWCTSGIQCIGDMEFVNIQNKYLALLECKRYKTKNTKKLGESVAKKKKKKKKLAALGRYWGCNKK